MTIGPIAYNKSYKKNKKEVRKIVEWVFYYNWAIIQQRRLNSSGGA